MLNETPIYLYAKKLAEGKINRRNQILFCVRSGYSDSEIKRQFSITNEFLNRIKKNNNTTLEYEF